MSQPKIEQIDSKLYAKINGLTNSTHSLVWHPLAFSEMATHWAKEAVSDTANAAPTANKVPNATADSVQLVDKTDNISSVIETSWSSVYYDFYGSRDIILL
ncbi:hypothetical protein J28TS4_14740 [Paenibacillus lautus]|uniref:hypothetical protein n=1 Tax=Paenibacillus lautus TaxID=1401 RepID=UPI001B26CBB4|nr:hypothetical protein [Paenibacillus lautus]GIP03067.1 hypothetical protein J28TS4_14740 [Paenibacillus lautus]